MLRKFTVSLFFVSLFFSQAAFSISQQTVAGNSDMLELAMLLPDLDVVATVDADRIMNIAAPSLLGQDAKKIEHLKNLMRTIENQIGLSPYEIRQIAFGLKLPAQSNLDSKEMIFKSDFTVLIRTANPNGNLLDNWSKRIDAIMAFKDEQAASRKYMDDFKRYRDFKYDKAAPEKMTATEQKFTASLKKTQEIAKTLDALPKLTTDAKAANNLRAKNKTVAGAINNYLSVLKADTDTKTFRETSIKLLNRWNVVTIDDGQRTAKLAAITSESKSIFPAYKQKFDNAAKLEALFNLIEPAPEVESQTVENLNDDVNSELDKTIAALDGLPAAKLKRTAELNSAAEVLDNLSLNLNGKLESLNTTPDAETIIANTTPARTDTRGFYETLKQAEREEKINGKRMIVINADKLDAPLAEKSADNNQKKEETLNLAVGILDEKTMAVGFEKTITPLLKRDAGYRNQKAVEMLGSSKNSLMAFAINSTVAQKFASESTKMTGETSNSDIFGASFLNKFTKDINIYGSVNYDADGSVTNDITMSLGFFREKAEEIALPENTRTNAADNPNIDNTFEIAGYQVGKDIFYDLFNSFKAVQASMTFKFEKKKIAALIRAAPQVIDKIAAAKFAAKKVSNKTADAKPNKLKSLPELLTAPQLYIDLAGLF